MKKLIQYIAILFFVVSSIGLFYTADRVQDLEDALKTARAELSDAKEAQNVALAEWQFLNTPSRLEQLAQKHLGLTQTSGRQSVAVHKIPARSSEASKKQEAILSDLYVSKNKNLSRQAVQRVSVRTSLKPRFAQNSQQRLIGVSLNDLWSIDYE